MRNIRIITSHTIVTKLAWVSSWFLVNSLNRRKRQKRLYNWNQINSTNACANLYKRQTKRWRGLQAIKPSRAPLKFYISQLVRAVIGLLSRLYFTVSQKFLFICKMHLKRNEIFKGKGCKGRKRTTLRNRYHTLLTVQAIDSSVHTMTS